MYMMRNIAKFFNSLNYVCIVFACLMVLGNIDFCENSEQLFDLVFNALLILMAGQYFRIVNYLILKGEE
tara:strand:- start:10596 stop:10802 length:207 start_codon:yes stop_codon:yes gene_type:complete